MFELDKNILFFLVIIFSAISLAYALTFIDNDSGDFGAGTYNYTEWNSTGNFTQLTANDTLQELPNNQRDELAAGLWGGINMTGNVYKDGLHNIK